jgi:hypothetical protein
LHSHSYAATAGTTIHPTTKYSKYQFIRELVFSLVSNGRIHTGGRVHHEG